MIASIQPDLVVICATGSFLTTSYMRLRTRNTKNKPDTHDYCYLDLRILLLLLYGRINK